MQITAEFQGCQEYIFHDQIFLREGVHGRETGKYMQACCINACLHVSGLHPGMFGGYMLACIGGTSWHVFAVHARMFWGG